MKSHKTKRGICYHARRECEGWPCPFHHPSKHHMRDWPAEVRFDKSGLTERTCPHGVGHTDPDSLAWLHRIVEAEGIHGCDGCCEA